MRFVRYNDWSQLPESARALFEQAESESLFFCRQWFECVAATALQADDNIVLACVLSGDEVMAILPLMESASNNIWYSLSHGFTPHYSLLLADGDHERVLTCLARALSQLPLKGLLLQPVDNDDSKLRVLQKCMTAAGFNCDYAFRHYNWIYRAQGQSYAQYMAARPAQLRNTISRKKRKLEREHGYEIRLFIGADALLGMADYYAVYNASWKQNEIKNAGFQDCFVEVFSRAGYSRLAILYVKGQPVAAQLWFVLQQKASIFRLAYDKAWRQYSAGSILTSVLMEYVIDTDRVHEIDFLTGNDSYKQDWMSERRERFLLSCVKSNAASGSYQRLAGALKRMLKRRKVRNIKQTK